MTIWKKIGRLYQEREMTNNKTAEAKKDTTHVLHHEGEKKEHLWGICYKTVGSYIAYNHHI